MNLAHRIPVEIYLLNFRSTFSRRAVQISGYSRSSDNQLRCGAFFYTRAHMLAPYST